MGLILDQNSSHSPRTTTPFESTAHLLAGIFSALCPLPISVSSSLKTLLNYTYIYSKHTPRRLPDCPTRELVPQMNPYKAESQNAPSRGAVYRNPSILLRNSHKLYHRFHLQTGYSISVYSSTFWRARPIGGLQLIRGKLIRLKSYSVVPLISAQGKSLKSDVTLQVTWTLFMFVWLITGRASATGCCY